LENETGWLLENRGMCLGIAADNGVHWMPFTAPEPLRFARRRDAEAFQRFLMRVRKKLRVCPGDVGDAVATEHAWVEVGAPFLEDSRG